MSTPDLREFHDLGSGSVARLRFSNASATIKQNGKENTHLYMVRVVVEVFAAPPATIEGTVEEYR
jgi:hypothetical protein